MRTLLTAVIAALLAAPVYAQTIADQDQSSSQGTQKPVPQTSKPKPKPTPKLPIGFHGFVSYDTTSMAASSTFKGVTGSRSVAGIGGGAEILNVWRKVFIRFGMANSSVDGTRGFVVDGEFVSTGVPLTIGVRYVELAAGWRTYPGRQAKLALYGGGGLLMGRIRQESSFALTGENDSASANGYVVLAGVEYALVKFFVVGVEGQYRSVKGGLLGGENTISGDFGEDDAGGAAIRALIGFRLRR